MRKKNSSLNFHYAIFINIRCAIRHDMMKSVLRFVERTQLAVYVTPMAKGSVDETHPQFRGVFAGNCSTEQVQNEVYNADLILSIGSMNSDFNTGGFSYRLSQKKTIGKFSFSSNFSKNIYRLLYL
jgi:pyruvate decarboxylase